jgi:hypothetical protein
VSAPALDPIAAHVGALARAVRGPARVRRGILREVRDGLDDAAEAYRRAGVDPERAARLAVRDFGPVAELAPLYQEELAAGEGRRTAALVAFGVPAVMLGWSLLWTSGLAAGSPKPPAVAVLGAVQDAAGVLATAVSLVLVVLGSRRAARPRRVAAAAAATALATVALCGGTAVAMNLLDAGHSWLRVTSQPASLLLYLGTAVMVVVFNRSAARTICALRGAG